MTHAPYSTRRTALLAEIGDGVAIVPTAPERLRNRDSHHPYRFDSYFWHLSGFPEPEAVMVLVGGKEPRSILFCREKNEEREVWDGFRYGPEAARDAFGFDETYPFAEFEQRLPDLQRLGAAGLVVNVESADTLQALRDRAPGLSLTPVPGDDLAQRLGLSRYPLLITATTIEQ